MPTNEIVYSQSEQIGLPNWSYINLLASAKATVELGNEPVAYDHLHAVINDFIFDRAERIVKALNVAFECEHEDRERVVVGQRHDDPDSIFSGGVECTFSLTEQIDMTAVKGQTCNTRLMASSKVVWLPTSIEEGFNYLADLVSAQMGQKRSAVLSNPRPWINNR